MLLLIKLADEVFYWRIYCTHAFYLTLFSYKTWECPVWYGFSKSLTNLSKTLHVLWYYNKNVNVITEEVKVSGSTTTISIKETLPLHVQSIVVTVHLLPFLFWGPLGGVMGRPEFSPPYWYFAFFSDGFRIWERHTYLWNLGTRCLGVQIHVIGFFNLIDLWVIKIREPMILCTCSTSRSSKHSTEHRSKNENMRKFCLYYSQNNKIVWLSNMETHFLEKFTRCTKVCGLFILDCAFWASKLWSHGYELTWNEHMRVSSTLIMPPALSNSPQ